MKLGAVPYLNALPLIRYLPERPRLESPALLDKLLLSGEIDLATAPVITLFDNPRFSLLPGIAIGCRGPVKSVRLFFRQRGMTVGDIRSLCLDPESRTSNILLQVLLHHRFNLSLGNIQWTQSPKEADATLMIGNKAMRREQASYESIDLGEEWFRLTGLPFVFAGWIGRSQCPADLINTLTNARDKGLQNLDLLVADDQTLPREEAKKYLSENISYRLGREEIEGLKRFHGYARELGLLRHDFELTLCTPG